MIDSQILAVAQERIELEADAVRRVGAQLTGLTARRQGAFWHLQGIAPT